MKIALISNWQTRECGVANFGRDWAAALERAGYEVVRLHYGDKVTSSGATFALYNWHPATTPKVVTPPSRPYGVYLHDIPPHSTCSLVDNAVAVWAAEPAEGTTCIRYPIYDGPLTLPPPASPITIGWTGLRGDGRDGIQRLCERRGWQFNGSTRWLDTPEEIQRLAASTLIVLWYFASGRGQSLALSTACATGRPILINDSLMFGMARDYPQEFHRAGHDPGVPFLEQAIEAVLSRVYTERAKVPQQVLTTHSWAAAIRQMEAAWTR